MSNKQYNLGVDIGGTFTDVNLLDLSNDEIINLKVPTDSVNPVEGILEGVNLLSKEGIDPKDIKYIVHGQTIGLNTLLQRKGSNIGLFVTEGFRDLLALQRLRLPVPYDFRSRLTKPIISREKVHTIKERLLHDGSVHTELDIESVDKAIDLAQQQKLDGIAICLLYSYKNPVHEKMIAERIKERAPNLEVCTSQELWPQAREYERAVMATINLFIQNKVKEYFVKLESSLREKGLEVTPYITQSNGGIMNMERAIKEPIRTLFSGPASGVIGAASIAESAGISNVITLDMGGTSADMSVIEDGNPKFTQNSEIGGFPIAIPTISINAIGAGGGSLAKIDKGGLLKVGPESAGSHPGPACYGNSNKPTLTDAFLLCGYLNPDRFAGGLLNLFPEKSYAAYQEIAEYLNIDVQNTADRVIQVAISKMYSELNGVIEKQGIDPREFSLIAFGGAGSLVANFLADELHMNSILIPPSPGTLCALGSLNADFMNDVVLTQQCMLDDISMNELNNSYEALIEDAKEWLSNQSATGVQDTKMLYFMDARYKGQSHETELLIDPSILESENQKKITDTFHQIHKKRYGHYDPDSSIEVINLRVRIIGYTQKTAHLTTVHAKEDVKPIAQKEIRYQQNTYAANVYLRSELLPGHSVSGPALIEQDDSTTLILDGWEASIDHINNLIISQEKINKQMEEEKCVQTL